jgi:hypothetical protein
LVVLQVLTILLLLVSTKSALLLINLDGAELRHTID